MSAGFTKLACGIRALFAFGIEELCEKVRKIRKNSEYKGVLFMLILPPSSFSGSKIDVYILYPTIFYNDDKFGNFRLPGGDGLSGCLGLWRNKEKFAEFDVFCPDTLQLLINNCGKKPTGYCFAIEVSEDETKSDEYKTEINKIILPVPAMNKIIRLLISNRNKYMSLADPENLDFFDLKD
jgi:hypothetical protein